MAKREREPTYQSLVESLTDFLEKEVPATEYCCSGTINELPSIKIDDDLQLQFPLNESMIQQLIQKSSIAPIGMGSETVINTDIRQGYQIDASRIHYQSSYKKQESTGFGHYYSTNNSTWDRIMNVELPERTNYGQTELTKIKQVLAPRSRISTKPYKLLIYEKDQFFKPHRDTLRSENHFASLVVFFPSQYEGGELVVRHQGKEKRFTYSQLVNRQQQQQQFAWVAFYTDCEHEILPVTSGHRVTMTFNIFFDDNVKPSPPGSDTELAIRFRQEMVDLLSDESFQQKFKTVGILLQHKYSQATLSSPSKLKGRDLLIYQVMSSGILNKELLKTKSSSSSQGGKYDKSKVATLKVLLEHRGLKKSGNKQELIDRLEEYDRKQEEKDDPSTTQSASTSTSTSSDPLPSLFDIKLRAVDVTLKGQGGPDERAKVGDIIDSALDDGTGVTIVDKELGSAGFYSNGHGSTYDTDATGSICMLYGLEGLREEKPKSKDFEATGNEGTEYELQYSHGMMFINLLPDVAEHAAKRQKVA
jgi:hypothetical protein